MSGLVKFLGSIIVPGIAASYAAVHLGIRYSRLFSFFASICGLLCYLRMLTQGGHLIDRRYRKRADLSGRVCLVTGATPGGLGHEAAKILAKMGATLVLTVRSEAKGVEAVAALGGGKASYVVVDFLSAASIRAGAATVLKRHPRLDILVLNAGVGGMAKVEETWMANHVGPFLWTQLLSPTLEATARKHGDTRIIAVSSHGHAGAYIDYDAPYERVKQKPDDEVAYFQSKLAQIMHMRGLQARLRAKSGLGGDSAIRCLAVSTGVAFTNIMASIPPLFRPLCWILFRSPEMGAQIIAMAAIDEAVPGGSFLTNCQVGRTHGVDDCSNQPAEWDKLWALSEKCAADGRFP